MNATTRRTHDRLKQGALGLLLVCGALVAGAALVAATPGAAFGAEGRMTDVSMAEPTADLTQEHLAAIGEAGTVYLSGTWSGFVNFPLPDGTTAWSDQIDASFSCSGFVASSDGYVVTAGHCADVAEGKTALVDQFLSDEIANGDITEADAQAYIAAGAEGAWPVEGEKTGEAPVLAMEVYPAISISSDDASGFTAVLQDDRPLGQGDVALFKIDAPSPLPVLVVSSEQPATGQKVDAIGYPGNVTDLVSGNPQPTFAQGQVSGRQQTDGGPFTQIGVTMSPGMSGGPVINGAGDVVGTISFGPSGDTQQLNFAAAPETITALLARNGVKNQLGDADARFRAGLQEYFAGKYHAAADDLAKAVAANPANAIAQQYQTKAVEAFPRENTTGWLVWVVVGGAVFLLLVIGLVLLLVIRGSRKRRRAALASFPADTPFSTLPAAAPAPLVPGGLPASSPGYAPAPAAASVVPGGVPASSPGYAPAPAAAPAGIFPADVPLSSLPAGAPVPYSAPAAAVDEPQPPAARLEAATPSTSAVEAAPQVTVPQADSPTKSFPPVAIPAPATRLDERGSEAIHANASPAVDSPLVDSPLADSPLADSPLADSRPATSSPATSPSPVTPAPQEPTAAAHTLAAERYCTSCGNTLRTDQRFCSGCGHPVTA